MSKKADAIAKRIAASLAKKKKEKLAERAINRKSINKWKPIPSDKIDTAKRLRANGHSTYFIARRLKISKSSVARITSGIECNINKTFDEYVASQADLAGDDVSLYDVYISLKRIFEPS